MVERDRLTPPPLDNQRCPGNKREEKEPNTSSLTPRKNKNDNYIFFIKNIYSFDSYWCLDWGWSGAADGCVFRMSDDDMVGGWVLVVVKMGEGVTL